MNYDLSTLETFGRAASKVFLENNIPLNNSIIKLAEVKNLNSEEINRVVEEANNVTHLSLFPKAEDKYIEFEVADATKISQAVFGPEDATTDKLADFRKAPEPQDYKYTLEKTAETELDDQLNTQDAQDPQADLSENQILKFSQAYNGAIQEYEDELSQQEFKFHKLTEKFYNNIKQEVLEGEKLANIKYAAQSAISKLTNGKDDPALDLFFNEVSERLKSAGITAYPYSEDLTLAQTINEDHEIVKAARDFMDIVNDYKEVIDKKASAKSKALILAGGTILGAAGVSGVKKILDKKKKDFNEAINNSPLDRRHLPQNAGFRAITETY